MKAGLLTIAALAASATAQVHHGRRHMHKEKRDVVVTQVEYVTATAPNAIVYVDGNGNPVSTKYEDQPEQTPAPYSPPKEPEAAAPAPVPVPAVEVPKPEAPKENTAATPSKAAESPKESAPASYDGGSTGQGIVYSPYKIGGCKNQEEVNADFAEFSGYGLVRIYGTDCDQVATVLKAAKAKNMKVFAGIFDISKVEAEAQIIINAAKNDWGMIDTVSVGNELVNAGAKSPSEVVAAVNQARGILQGGGYTGNVVTVDTFVAMIAHPELCQASDYAAANCHAFFDGGKSAEQAGDFVKDQAKRVAVACNGKKVVITETGWPWSGQTNGLAVPSKENQAKAIASLKSKFSENIVLFTAFDDTWKTDTAATYGAEQFWGFIKQSA